MKSEKSSLNYGTYFHLKLKFDYQIEANFLKKIWFIF